MKFLLSLFTLLRDWLNKSQIASWAAKCRQWMQATFFCSTKSYWWLCAEQFDVIIHDTILMGNLSDEYLLELITRLLIFCNSGSTCHFIRTGNIFWLYILGYDVDRFHQAATPLSCSIYFFSQFACVFLICMPSLCNTILERVRTVLLETQSSFDIAT